MYGNDFPQEIWIFKGLIINVLIVKKNSYFIALENRYSQYEVDKNYRSFTFH